MTKQEAEKVALIVMMADGGCMNCTSKLIDTCIADFPEHAELFRETWEKENDTSLDTYLLG